MDQGGAPSSSPRGRGRRAKVEASNVLGHLHGLDVGFGITATKSALPVENI
jgi:hypothetical protein